jgi:hypothetical protein
MPKVYDVRKLRAKPKRKTAKKKKKGPMPGKRLAASMGKTISRTLKGK